MTRTFRRTLGPLAVAAAALGVAAVPAVAGTAKIHSCTDPAGNAIGIEGWQAFSNHNGQGDVSTGNQCGPGGLAIEFGPKLTWNSGAYGQWNWYAPADTTITNFKADRRIRGIASGDWNYISGTNRVNWEIHAPATDIPNYARMDVNVSDDTMVFLQLACGGPGQCARNSSFNEARLDVRNIAITIRDGHDPVVTDIAGELATAETVSGTAKMTYNAADKGLGVYREIVYVDGNEVSRSVVNSNDGRCTDAGLDPGSAYEFVRGVPCRLSTAGDVDLDTTQLSEGEHTVRVLVEDGAGNTTTALATRTITVNNVPPPSLKTGSRPTIQGTAEVGKQLQANPGEWNGDHVSYAYQWMRCDADAGNCVDIGDATGQTYIINQRDVERRLKVRVTASNAEGTSSPSTSAPTAMVTAAPAPVDRTPAPPTQPSPGAADDPRDRGAANGSGATDRVRLSAYVGTGRRTTIRARYGRSTRITGQLLDSDGQPISGAVLQVQAGVHLPGSPLEEVGTVRTNRDGRYTYTLAAGPSRLVRLAYRSHLGDTQFADTTDVLVMVRAGVSLRPRPQKLRNGRSVVFRGTVARPLPRRGVLVDLQVRIGKQWRTFGVARSRRDGRYSYRYRFRRTYRTTTFKFRARARRESQYPYLDGYSRIVKVKVRGA